MKVLKVSKEYFETGDEKVYFFEPLEKEISVEDIGRGRPSNETVGLLMMKKNDLKVGDIVRHWGIDFDTPDPWHHRLFYSVKHSYYQITYFFRNHVIGRIKCGFPPSEVADFYSHHSRWCVARLKLFRKLEQGYPTLLDNLNHSDQKCFDFLTENGEERRQKWHEILDKMIWSFENVDKEPDPINPPNYDDRQRVVENRMGDGVAFENVDQRPLDWTPITKHRERVQEGLDLFAKYYTCLWS